MDLSLLLNVLTTAAVVGGVIFGAWQVRVAAKTRSTEVTLQLLQMLHNLDLTEGITALMDQPTGLGEVELRQRLGENWARAFHAVLMLDGLGLLVYRGEVDEKLAEDFFKHAIAEGWEKFKVTALDLRKKQGDKALEWLQWLAEKQAASPARNRAPVYVR
jgi:hypothetical protein